MKRIRILIIFLISFSVILPMEKYSPRTKQEREYLEKIRKRKLTIGIKEHYFAAEKIEGRSFNDIVVEMLKDYLGLDIVLTVGDWDSNYNKFKSKEIDVLTYLTQIEERRDYAIFTKPILEEDLMIISKDRKLDTLSDLNGLDVVVTKDSIYQKFLERFINKNEINLNMVEVLDVDNQENSLYVDSDLNLIGEKNKLNLGKLPPASLGVLKEHGELVRVIDNALKEKYEFELSEWTRKRKEKIFKEKLEKALTLEEKEYLKTLPPIKVAYGNIEKISMYSFLENRYIGIVPTLLNYLSEKMGIELIERTDLRKSNWRAWGENFLRGEIDVIIYSKTPEREKEFLFTKKISDLNVYEITSLAMNERTQNKVGVIKETVEESVAKDYYLRDEIVVYQNETKLIQDFKNKKLSKILSLNAEINNISKYEVKILDIVPVNLIINKEYYPLRDILNKAIDELVDMQEFMEISDLTRKKDEIYEKRAQKNIIGLVAISCILLIILAIYQTIKMLKHKEANKELLRDELTGLYSRRVYNEFCKENIRLNGCAILLDLNNFKIVNDTYGHDYGDKILVEVGRCLQKVFNRDYTFRISGDEFYIFLNCIEDVELKFKKLKKLFKDSTILRTYNISFSLGYYYKKDNVSMIDAFKYADMAMYFAKREKKEWYEEATDEFINQNERKKKLEILIKKGFDKEFYAVFQGKYDLNTKDLIGAEALTRWSNSDLGLVPPIEFIPVAEELGMIHKIDYKIAELAVKETKKLLSQNRVKDDFRMSFNMSVETFRRSDIVDYVLNLLEKYSLDGKNLEIEITESIFLKDAKNVILKLQLLSEKGIYISIDDFTAGYSTVGLLTTLPIDVVKFDRSLISTICEDSDKGRSVYIGLAKMIKSLKLKVVAEGIEGKEQYEFLREIGINYGQGYYLGKPERILQDSNN